jgi:uncharacterized protein
MKNALIIFVRHPELGKVKTRLAKSVGEEKALSVYTYLLKITHDIAINIHADKYVFYTDEIITNDCWEMDLFIKRRQEGETLGEKMKNAFLSLFKYGYTKLVIIGSDCPELTASQVIDAFQKLDSNGVVIGPATDGGYYLLGLTQMIPELFHNKQWSTDTVLADTILDIEKLSKSSVMLPKLSDIDTEDDLQKFNF